MLPHEGLGVDGYVWATSPLRRYSDLVNQWQIICYAMHGASAKLVAPFKQKDEDLLYLINNFSETYAAYNDAQYKIERYWCLRWIKQQNITMLEGILGKEGLLRFNSLPFSTVIPELMQYNRGSLICVKILELDEVELDIKAQVINITAN
jgi:exoribonuclease II